MLSNKVSNNNAFSFNDFVDQSSSTFQLVVASVNWISKVFFNQPQGHAFILIALHPIVGFQRVVKLIHNGICRHPPTEIELRLFDKQDIKLIVMCDAPNNFDGAIIFDNKAIVLSFVGASSSASQLPLFTKPNDDYWLVVVFIPILISKGDKRQFKALKTKLMFSCSTHKSRQC
jgi:hypothetical protein